MGVVYRARDTRLDRSVALKALPAAMANDAAARADFDREARLLASLEHPHVAPIYGVEDTPDGSYLVLQLVQGETLGRRLARGPLGFDLAVDVLRQVASGIAAAHAREIVHCDLKPANIMISDDGVAKIVDFGIARRWHRPAAGARRAEPDASSASGTPAYMAPEQILGETIDPRTDVWAFGCLIVECVRGQRLFPSSSPEETLALIRQRDAATSPLPADAPAAITRLAQRCLVVELDGRLASMAEAVEILGLIAASTARPGAAPARALPEDLSSFVGREQELAAVAGLLDGCRLLTLTGSAGCGKTRLALEMGRRAAPRFPDGVFFAPLASVADPARVASATCDGVGVSTRGQPDPELALVAALGGGRRLLILDNCEHVLDATSELCRTLLRACPELTVACTSREALGFPGETTWRVPSLAAPPASLADAAALQHFDAVRLFVDRAREVRPDFALDETNAAVIAQIVVRLDGIPLALELAAARLRALSPEQILERLGDRFRLLTGGRRTALERHQTLRTALDWSHDLLSPDEQRCLRELSVFAGGFRLEEATRACTGDEFEVLDLVTALVNKSLVQVDQEPRKAPRYAMLESVRQYAQDRLDQSGEGLEARRRHRDCYRRLAVETRAATGAGHRNVFLDREMDNLRAAIEWSLDDPEGGGAALEMVGALALFFDAAGHPSEGRTLIERALAHPDAPRDGSVRATAIRGLSALQFWLGDLDAARARAAESAAMFRAAGDVAGEAAALMHAGMVLHSLGKLEEARTIYADTLARADEVGDHHLACTCLNNLSVISRDMGDQEAAREHAEKGLERSRAPRNHAAEARALGMLGQLARDRGELEAAEALLERARELHTERLNRRELALLAIERGHIARLRDDLHRAADLYREAASAFREAANHRGLALALGNLGEVERQIGRLPEAREALREALGFASRVQHRTLSASIVGEFAFALAAAGEVAEAVRLHALVATARSRMNRRLTDDEQATLDAEIATLRGRLGDAAFDEAWRAGEADDLDATITRLTTAEPDR